MDRGQWRTESERRGSYGSLLAVTPIGVFFNTEMFVARSLMSFAESSRSRATLAASLPVSFWTF